MASNSSPIGSSPLAFFAASVCGVWAQDAEQTKLKQLQRQVKRERKGAMRELKRDAVFLEHAKAEKTEEKEKARQVIPRAAAILNFLYVVLKIICRWSYLQLKMNGHRLRGTYIIGDNSDPATFTFPGLQISRQWFCLATQCSHEAKQGQ